ncbi:oligosaccharide flippase family protein [Myxococcota bacterium]|nr:oligosaccharide flippase family protein [Myxococcota bacterium]
MSTAASPEPRPARGRVALNTALLVAAQGAASGIGFVTVAVAARGLGAAEFGRFSFLLSVAAGLQMVADFGIGTVLTRELARTPDGGARDLWAGLGLRLALGVIAGLGMLALAASGAGPFGGALPAAALLALLPGISGVAGAGRAAIRAGERMEWILALTAGEAALRLVLTVSALAAGLGLLGVAWAAVLGPAAAAAGAMAVGWGMVAGGRLRGAGDRVLPLLREAWPFGLAAVAGAVAGRLDLWLVAAWLGDEATGLYAAGGRGLDALRGVAVALFGALLPAVARSARGVSGREAERRAAAASRTAGGVAAALALAVAAGLGIAARPLLGAVFGGAFEPAAPAFRVQVLAIVPYAVGTVLCVRLAVHGRGGAIAAAQSVAAAGSFALAAWWIPRWGILGAAAATLAREVATAALYALAIRALPARL